MRKAVLSTECSPTAPLPKKLALPPHAAVQVGVGPKGRASSPHQRQRCTGATGFPRATHISQATDGKCDAASGTERSNPSSSSPPCPLQVRSKNIGKGPPSFVREPAAGKILMIKGGKIVPPARSRSTQTPGVFSPRRNLTSRRLRNHPTTCPAVANHGLSDRNL